MSPSHSNKKGVRYRYYVSQALLQSRADGAGSISRVAAPDVEELVVAALRHQVSGVASTRQAVGLKGAADWEGGRDDVATQQAPQELRRASLMPSQTGMPLPISR
jgi:hypothetical protein